MICYAQVARDILVASGGQMTDEGRRSVLGQGGRRSADVLQEVPEKDIPRRPRDHRAGHLLKGGRGADLGNGDDWRTGGTPCWASRGCPF